MEEPVLKRIVQSAQSGIVESLWNVIGFFVMFSFLSYLLTFFLFIKIVKSMDEDMNIIKLVILEVLWCP